MHIREPRVSPPPAARQPYAEFTTSFIASRPLASWVYRSAEPGGAARAFAFRRKPQLDQPVHQASIAEMVAPEGRFGGAHQ